MSAPDFDRRVTPARPDLAADFLRGRIEAPRYAAGRHRSVSAACVPLRREPNPEEGIDTELLRGEAFTVYDEDAEGWSWGQAEADGYVGWLPSAALGAPETPTHAVSVLRSFVYPGPSIKRPAVSALPFGALVEALGAEASFTRIAEGFVWTGHLEPVGILRSDPVVVAEMYLGAPYLWGGKSSLGLDCSALVQTALRACGKPAPRDSDMQERALGTPVDPDGPLRRGDLVFWRGHVGLMQDVATLLHANGYTMTVACEDFRAARARILHSGGGEVTSARRL
jgi:cell wall-associated NlpC family hydrolase